LVDQGINYTYTLMITLSTLHQEKDTSCFSSSHHWPTYGMQEVPSSLPLVFVLQAWQIELGSLSCTDCWEWDW
jgi:hypothetical protein